MWLQYEGKLINTDNLKMIITRQDVGKWYLYGTSLQSLTPDVRIAGPFEEEEVTKATRSSKNGYSL